MKDSSGRTHFSIINIQNFNIISMKTFSYRYLIKKHAEKKTYLLMGNFNLNLLNSENKSEISEF